MNENIDFPMFYNRHYVKVDENGVVLDAFSDGPLYEKSTDGYICFNEEGGYQLRLKLKDENGNTVFSQENEPITDFQGVKLYKYVDGFFVKRTEEEKAPDYEAFLPSLDEVKNEKQEENKIALAKFLKDNPLQYTDGKYYGITLEDQQEMALNMLQYQAAVSAGVATTLQWHSVRAECRDWSLEEFTALTVAISNFVYPYLRQQEQIKTNIYACTTRDEVANIKIEYTL